MNLTLKVVEFFQVVNNSLNPVWNQTFDIVVEDGLHDMLIVEVWDHDTFGKVKYLHHLVSCFPSDAKRLWPKAMGNKVASIV